MNSKQNRRITSIYISFALVFLILSAKIVYLQIFRKVFFQKLAANQHYRIVPIEGGRGDIFDRQGRFLAKGINCYSVFADPVFITQKSETAQRLAEHLGLPYNTVKEKLDKDKRFVWLKRKISWEEKKKIEALDLDGIGFLREEKRFYPQKTLASSLIGIAGIDNKGLEGIELWYNDYLRGKDGLVRLLRDSTSKEIFLYPSVLEPQKGAQVFLTIDAQIQYWVEHFANKTIEEFKAASASIIVMNAENGEILAMANLPSFDPNNFQGIRPEEMRNKAIADLFEPGSVFKVIALAAAVSENRFANDDVFFCEDGKYKVPGTILNDWRPYGNLTFEEVFMKSSNIGVGKVVEGLGTRVYSRYIDLFEFGTLTGIDLPAEARGLTKPYQQWSKTSSYIIPIGQEIGVSLLQLARAFAVFTNGGNLVKPFVVERICSRDFCKYTQPVRKRILPDFIAKRAEDILIKVVSEGTGTRAAIEGVTIGGKTGTAQKFDIASGRYSPNDYRATFVGFLGKTDPPLVIAVSVDEPRKSHFGGVVAAPLFRQIAEKALLYVSPEESIVSQ